MLFSYLIEDLGFILNDRFLSPLGAIPLVILTGLGLYALGFPNVRILSLSLCCGTRLPRLLLLLLPFFFFF